MSLNGNTPHAIVFNGSTDGRFADLAVQGVLAAGWQPLHFDREEYAREQLQASGIHIGAVILSVHVGGTPDQYFRGQRLSLETAEIPLPRALITAASSAREHLHPEIGDTIVGKTTRRLIAPRISAWLDSLSHDG